MHHVSRAELREAIGKPCLYCGEPMAFPTRDHIHPRTHGGTLDGPNKALACLRCNQDKGCSTLRRWRRRLCRANDPRAAIVGRLIDSRSVQARWLLRLAGLCVAATTRQRRARQERRAERSGRLDRCRMIHRQCRDQPISSVTTICGRRTSKAYRVLTGPRKRQLRGSYKKPNCLGFSRW
ncbi:MAG: HNH endonuclease [Bradyrhizobiaceae bacterium]|nr:MAG: HNH endonuclease [Bradyrhizobiaceae bacterium]